MININKSSVMMIGLAAAGMFLWQKQARAATVKAQTPVKNTNVNSDMWTRLLGGAWKQLEGAQNSDGSAAFLTRNFAGRPATSDGKPVSTGDSYFDWMATNTGLDGNYTDAPYSDQVNNLVDNMFPLSEGYLP